MRRLTVAATILAMAAPALAGPRNRTSNPLPTTPIKLGDRDVAGSTLEISSIPDAPGSEVRFLGTGGIVAAATVPNVAPAGTLPRGVTLLLETETQAGPRFAGQSPKIIKLVAEEPTLEGADSPTEQDANE